MVLQVLVNSTDKHMYKRTTVHVHVHTLRTYASEIRPNYCYREEVDIRKMTYTCREKSKTCGREDEMPYRSKVPLNYYIPYWPNQWSIGGFAVSSVTF